MCRTHHNVHAKAQIGQLFQSWQCGEPLPRKGQKVLIAFAGKTDLASDLIEVELTQMTGTYDGRLYKATMSSRAGRAFDLSVQQSHVVVFAHCRFYRCSSRLPVAITG